MLPSSRPPVVLSPESIQWLVDQRLITPNPLGAFANVVAGAKRSDLAPAALGALGLDPRISDRKAAGYRRAVEIAAAPDRKISVHHRAVLEEELALFYVQGSEACLCVLDQGTVAVSTAFATATLCSTLAKKLTADAPSTVALLPELLGSFGRAFVAPNRTLSPRPEAELREAFGAMFDGLVEVKLLRADGSLWLPDPDYADALSVTWSGHAIVVEVRTGDDASQRRVLSFFGPPGRLHWVYDSTLPNGHEVAVYQRLNAKEAAEMAGAIASV